ncbi:hypothetical protein ERO13_A01G134200v2 [Gossypium hirsutum]|nr:hypothetical protein ERO13_A01G134200v2 [Gossypium hirsutum]
MPEISSLFVLLQGFVTAISNLGLFVPAIYDITVAIPKTSPSPTLLRLFNGQSSVVYVHIKRRLMKQLPETDEAVAQWCKDIFVEKDKLFDKHIAEDTFSDQPSKDMDRRPINSLLGIALSAFGLANVTILMQILILFTQSECSNPAAKVAPRKPPKNDPQSPNSLWKSPLA